MQWPPCNTCVSTDRNLLFISHLIGCLCSRRGYSQKKSIRGGSVRKGGTFFRLQVYERVGILLAEVYERVGESVIWVC